MTTAPCICRFVGALLFLISAVPLLGQHRLVGTPEIINFSKSDYHAGTQNWTFVQGGNGIIFVGNNKGLLEYDGTTWRNIQLPNRTILRSLAKDKKGNIFIGGQDEFGVLEANSNGQFEYRSMVDQIPENFRSFEDLWKIFPVDEGIFFCSQRIIFLWKNGQIETIQPQQRFENFFELEGKIYAQEVGVGLVVWEQGKFSLVPGGEQFANGRVAAMLPKDRETNVVVSDFRGLFLMDSQGIRPWATASDAFLRKNQAYCAIWLQDQRYAIGTVSDGLIIVDQDGRPDMHLNKASGLQNNTVLSVFQDERLNLWLGLDNGIDYAKISTPFTYIRSESGIEGTGYATTVHEDRLYFGTNQGLFYLNWNEARNPFEPFGTRISQLKTGQVWNLQQLGTDVFVGMHEGAFLLQNENMSRLPVAQGAWKFMELEGLPNYAICGTYSGILLYEKNAGSWVFKKKLEGFDESARVMEEDANGNIWVSHAYKGLFRIKLDEQLDAAPQVRFYTIAEGLPTNISINVAKVKGEVLFTTPDGIYSYDKNSDRFLPHAGFNEILGGKRNIHRIIEDQLGNIWYSIDDEFGVLQIKEKGFLKNDKVIRWPFNQIQGELVDGFENIYAHDAHNVFIATEKGFIHYNPSLDKKQDTTFRVLIREVVSIAEQDSTLFGGSRLLNGSPDEALELPFSIRSLRFSFSAPFFEHLGQIEYRFKLVGYDENWSDWSLQSKKEFTNLPHGEYQFLVEARNAYGQISLPDQFNFSISPPWYATAFAKFTFLLLAVLLVVALLRYFSIKLEKEKAAIVQEKNQVLERKEAKFKVEKEQSEAEIVRLRNENLRSDLKHKNAQLAAATMHLVQKGEILLKIKNELGKLAGGELKESKRKAQQLVRLIDENIQLDDNWEQFELHFDQVHENFLQNLREAYPNLTPKDQKLCAYLRMNLTTKEIAPLMNISVRGVEISRYRLRKKLELETDTNLVDFIMKF